jgi:phosphoglycolate phosphatase
LKDSGFKLYIVTARQKKEKVITQINTFGWHSLFEKILVTEQKFKKSELIKPNIGNSTNNWMIGDTGMDIIEGQELKINTIAVLTGFLSEKILEGYSPDKIVSTILSIKPSELLEKI